MPWPTWADSMPAAAIRIMGSIICTMAAASGSARCSSDPTAAASELETLPASCSHVPIVASTHSARLQVAAEADVRPNEVCSSSHSSASPTVSRIATASDAAGDGSGPEDAVTLRAMSLMSVQLSPSPVPVPAADIWRLNCCIACCRGPISWLRSKVPSGPGVMPNCRRNSSIGFGWSSAAMV